MTGLDLRESMMTEDIEFDRTMNRYRLASRELYNNYFYTQDPHLHWDEFVSALEILDEVDQLLFWALVSDPFQLPRSADGSRQMFIQLRHEETPVMLNREIDSGYWDYPIAKLPRETPILFMGYFDWNQQGYRDYQYVRGKVLPLPHVDADIHNKNVLIACLDVRFTRSNPRQLGLELSN